MLVLGQPAGFVPIPNRRIAEELARTEAACGQVSGGTGGSSSGRGGSAVGSAKKEKQPQSQPQPPPQQQQVGWCRVDSPYFRWLLAGAGADDDDALAIVSSCCVLRVLFIQKERSGREALTGEGE